MRAQLKNALYKMKLSLALALAPVAAFVAPVLLRVEISSRKTHRLRLR